MLAGTSFLTLGRRTFRTAPVPDNPILAAAG